MRRGASVYVREGDRGYTIYYYRVRSCTIIKRVINYYSERLSSSLYLTRFLLELVSKLPYCDKHTREMDKGAEHRTFSLIACDQSTEATEPTNSTLNAVASFVSPKLAPILSLGFFPILAMGTDQVNASFGQPIPQGIRVGRPIIDQSWESTTRTTRSGTRHRNLCQQRLNQGHFVRRRRGKFDSQRHTLAVCHHHKLHTLSAFGFSDQGPPFLAPAKVPSANTSCQSSWPWASNSPKKARPALSHTSASCHSWSRRQQVLKEGYPRGRSTSRSGMRLRPPLGERGGLGNKDSILAHWASVTSPVYSTIGYTPFDGRKIARCRSKIQPESLSEF